MTHSNSPVNSADHDENRAWAREFPAEALKWLRSAPEGGQRIAIAEIAGPELAQTDPAAAVRLAEDCLGDGTHNEAQYLLDNLAQQWAEKDMPSASVWALAKPVGEQRDRLLQRIAIVDAKTNPEQAARLIVEQMEPGPTQDEAAISVLHQWVHRDAPAALAWAEAFPTGDLRDRAIEEVRNAIAFSSENKPQGTSPN